LAVQICAEMHDCSENCISFFAHTFCTKRRESLGESAAICLIQARVVIPRKHIPPTSLSGKEKWPIFIKATEDGDDAHTNMRRLRCVVVVYTHSADEHYCV